MHDGALKRKQRELILSRMAWFGLMRVSEVAPKRIAGRKFDEAKALRTKDVCPTIGIGNARRRLPTNSAEDWERATGLMLTIRRSKTDQAGKGFEREMNAAVERNALCPIKLFEKFASMDTTAWEAARANNETLGATHTTTAGRITIAAHDIENSREVEGKKAGR